MKTKTQNLIATAILMIFAMMYVPTNNVWAQTETIIAYGTFGNNTLHPTGAWTLDQSGTLTISGTGATQNFSGFNMQPWWGFRAFIVNVVIEEGITGLGNNGLASLAKVRTLHLPASFNTMGIFAGDGLVGLEHVFIAENNVGGFHDIDGVWFRHDTILFRYPVGRTATSYTIPDGVTAIQANAFSHNAMYSWAAEQAVRSLTSVVIPEGVHTIGMSAFHSSGLTSVTLPSTLLTLGMSAFTNSDLTGSVVIPQGVTAIPDNLFQNTAITSVTIPEGVISIAVNAFAGTQLTTVALPNSLTSIANANAFEISTLQSITVGSENPNFVVVDDVLYIRRPITGEIESYRIVRYPSARPGTTWTIPTTIDVGGTTFDVSGINASAFSGNANLEFVDFSNIATTFEEIGNSAFVNATALTSLILPDSTEENPKRLWRIGANAFNGARSLTTVVLPNTLTTIDAGAFAFCRALTSIELPIGITGTGTSGGAPGFLGTDIFAHCVSLTTVILPDSLVFIPSGMFSNSGLTELTIPARVNGIRTGDAPTVARIGANAFLNSRLERLIVEWDEPPTVTTTGNGNVITSAFNGVNVARVVLETPSDYEDAFKAAEFWRNFAFELQNEGSIADGNITWKCFDNGLLTISGTGHMDNFSAHSDGTTAPWNVCRATTQIIIIDTAIASIGANAFRGFEELGTLTIPNTVETIGAYAFANAEGLGTVNVSWQNPISIDENVFDNVAIGGVVLAVTPASRAITYFHAPVWGDFMFSELHAEVAGELTWVLENNVLHITGTGDMEDYEFIDILGTTAPWAEFNSSIHIVNIGEGVTSIGANAFLGHTSLTVVNIPESVERIGNFAFLGCRSLRVVSVNSTTPPTLGNAIFEGVTLSQSFLFVPEGYNATFRASGSPWNAFNGHLVVRGIAPAITVPVASAGIPRRIEIGEFFTETLTASSTPAFAADVVVWSATGAAAANRIPPGLSLTAGGILSGTPTEAGTFTFTLWAANATGRASRSFTIVVSGTSIVDSLQAELEACANNKADLLAEVDSLQNEIETFEALVDELNRIIDSLQIELDKCLAEQSSSHPHTLINEVSIYPNPVVDQLNIINFEWRAGDVVELFDMNGRRVFMERVNAPVETFTINMSAFHSGTYILRIGDRIARVIKQ